MPHRTCLPDRSDANWIYNPRAAFCCEADFGIKGRIYLRLADLRGVRERLQQAAIWILRKQVLKTDKFPMYFH
jgi:hypothetical protein